jgi:hypothetical protein
MHPLHMFNSVSKQIGLYGCEVLGTDTINIKHSNLFHNWNKLSCYRAIIKVAKSILDQPRRCSNVGESRAAPPCSLEFVQDGCAAPIARGAFADPQLVQQITHGICDACML